MISGRALLIWFLLMVALGYIFGEYMKAKGFEKDKPLMKPTGWIYVEKGCKQLPSGVEFCPLVKEYF